MAVSTDPIEARLSPDERARIERAASTSGLSVSAFLVSSAVARANGVISAATSTRVPADYFAIAPHPLQRNDAPGRLARGGPKQIPAIVLAKLALDVSVQDHGMGSELLDVALNVIVSAARRAAGRAVVVDAISDSAQAFCEHHDFMPPPGQTHRLVMKLSSVAQALGTPWPSRRDPAGSVPTPPTQSQERAGTTAVPLATATARSNELPTLHSAEGARFTVVRRLGQTRPLHNVAARARSRTSRHEVSGSPTTVNLGSPAPTCASTVTLSPSAPSTVADDVEASMTGSTALAAAPLHGAVGAG